MPTALTCYLNFEPSSSLLLQHETNEPQSSIEENLPQEGKDWKEKSLFCEKVARNIAMMPKRKEDVTKEDIFVEIIAITYGNGQNDPLENVDFINKEGTVVKWRSRGRHEGSLKFLTSFQDQYIRVYARDGEKKEIKQEITHRFYNWCKKRGLDVPEDMEKTPVEHDDDEDAMSPV